MDYDSLHALVRRAETNYLSGVTKLGNYVDFDMHEVIEKITAYLNSRHISGSQDALGRDKPFFNIVTAAVNIWYRATDLDRKDISIQPNSASTTVAAFLATVLLQGWMKRERFGVFLNQWGRTLAQYGSAVVKFVKHEGRLILSVVPWSRLIVDAIDFEALPRIEKFYLTPAQLKQSKLYDAEQVEALRNARQSREDMEGQTKDNISEFIELYEVHGEMPLSYLTNREEDEEKYVQQMHVISYVKGEDDKYNDFTLYKGREEKDPYMITHLIEEDGRTLAIGAVEYLFDAQWMQNHTIKAWKDQMDLASKMVFQTSDPKFVGRNILTAIETGTVLYHQANMPLTKVDNIGHDIQTLQAFSQQWKVLAQELTSTPDAMRGNTLPSGTPYSLGAYLGGQANSLFEVMTENKGLAIEDMLRIHIIPFLKEGLDTKEEVSAILDDREITKIDSLYVPRAAIKRYNNDAKRKLIEGEVPSPIDLQSEMDSVKQEMAPLGNQRFISPDDVEWNEVFKDLEWKVEVNVSNEMTDKQVLFTTLSSVLQTVASNPTILTDPNARMLFNKILAHTGMVSPVEMATTSTAPRPTTQTNTLEALAGTNTQTNA